MGVQTYHNSDKTIATTIYLWDNFVQLSWITFHLTGLCNAIILPRHKFIPHPQGKREQFDNVEEGRRQGDEIAAKDNQPVN